MNIDSCNWIIYSLFDFKLLGSFYSYVCDDFGTPTPFWFLQLCRSPVAGLIFMLDLLMVALMDLIFFLHCNPKF